MQTIPINNRSAIQKLTALWALSESGLGGLLHAFKSPFSGLLLGSFAVIIICCIAHFSKSVWKDVTQATILVLLVKAAVSPHSPPTAYLAVGFQGLFGAMVLQAFGSNLFSKMLFGCIALLESALQKVLVTTLIFGKDIWEAIDVFAQQVLQLFSVKQDVAYSYWLIAAYILLYACVGILVGFWAHYFLRNLNQKANKCLQNYTQSIPKIPPINTKKKKKNKWLIPVITLVFIVLTFSMQGSVQKGLYVLLRTIVILLALHFLIRPLVIWLIQKWRHKSIGEHASELASLHSTIPEIRNRLKPAYAMAKAEYKGWRVFTNFVQNIIIITLYVPTDIHTVESD